MKRDYSKKMSKGNFFKYYNRLNGADAYMVMFLYDGKLWLFETSHIKPRWTVEARESTKNGGFQKWKMSLKKAHKEQLIKAGAVVVATAEEFNNMPYSNKGHKCECLLHHLYDLGEYTPDRVRFDKDGDITINGIKYQVKFENASLTNVRTLRKAQDDARK